MRGGGMHLFSSLPSIIPMTNKNILFLLLAVGVFGLLGVSAMAHAQAPGAGYGGFMGGGRMGGGMGRMPGIAGKVTAIDGTNITVQGARNGATSYNVNASNATVRKNNATSSVSAIVVGDTIMVRGTVSGTSVTATNIFDGSFGGMRGGPRGWGSAATSTGRGTPSGRGAYPLRSASGTPSYASGTVPTVMGTVAAINGSMLTITGNDGMAYMVDASNATLIKQGSPTSSVSAIAVGDNVQIKGTVNGTSVTATIITDNIAPAAHKGFLGAIQDFINNLFHFRF
jgi:hypothetical protein